MRSIRVRVIPPRSGPASRPDSASARHPSRGGIALRVGVLALSLLTALLPHLSAQESERRLRFETELGASVFFGNTEQVTFTNRSEISRADSVAEVSVGWDITYGEASNEEGETFVNRRSWTAGSTVDLRPHSRVSPFLFGTLEYSLQKRIDQRFSGGSGAKFTFIRSDISLLDVSVAALAERTVPRNERVADTEIIARWSIRSRARRSFDSDRLALGTEIFYVPAFRNLNNFTLRSTSSVSFALSTVMSLRVSFVDAYDSGARDRGARTNNDGQLLFSILSRF